MKSVFLILVLTISISVSAQNVGINTNSPEATLHVAGSPTATNVADGVIPPKLTGNELKAKDNAYTTAKNGAMVYVTAAASPTTTKTANVTEAGFYYFDGSVWQRVVRSTTPTPGQLLNSVFIDDPAMVLPGSFSSETFTNLVSYSYTPVYSSSKIMVQYHNSSYTINGGQGPSIDEFQSQVSIGGSGVTVNTQQPSQLNTVNSTFRTGSLFPIAGVSSTTGTGAITINIQVRKSSGDDQINFNGTNGTLIIQEIAR